MPEMLNSGFHMTLECMDTKPLTRFWVHHNVSTQKGRPEPTNTPDQKHSRYHRQIHKLKSKITSGNNVMKSHRAPSVKQTEKLSKMHLSTHIHTGQIPWLALVQLHHSDHISLDRATTHFAFQIVRNELFISGMKPKTWRHSSASHELMSILSSKIHTRALSLCLSLSLSQISGYN
jgi:hypothetical protein